jgi:hypothetical protein
MTKKFRLLRACRQRRNAQIIMGGMLALCLLAACAGPAGASTGSGGATTATSPGKHSRSWPDLNPVDWAKYMCDGATSLGGCISNYYQDYSKGNVVIHTALGGQIAADASLIPGFGLAVLMSDINLAIQGKDKGGSWWTVYEDIPGLIPGSKVLENLAKIKADSGKITEGVQAWNNSQKLKNIEDGHQVGGTWAQIHKNNSGNHNQSSTSNPPAPPGGGRPAQATAVKTFEPWVAAGQGGGAAPVPGLVVTNGGTATCDSGSADDPGSAVAVRCSPPGNGTPCYINDIGGGDPGSPLLCSSDPTSNQVIAVTPTGPHGIPPDMLNPGDPSQPPWFLILADGRKCHFLGYGTNTNALSYDCGNNIGATVPDRSSPTWTVQEGQLQADPTASPARVAVVTAYRGKTSFAAPSASPTPAPATPAPASAVVQDYYAAINAHDYQSAWSLGGKNLAGSYDSFVKGFANTASDSVTVASLADNTVMIQLDSTQTDGSHRYFTGTYTVQNDEIVSAVVIAR